ESPLSARTTIEKKRAFEKMPDARGAHIAATSLTDRFEGKGPLISAPSCYLSLAYISKMRYKHLWLGG
ncbi:MAG: hypothetical protein WAN05_19825, partial [Roseiarcus sp.]